MRVNNLVILFLILFSLNIHARVRDLEISSGEMGKIYLKMGKSTILRFADKPKKVVIGNQNYFNVEFIDNDVTIQPLGVATTNLFVYGEYQTYGLILSVIGHDNYDDLVMVKRKSFSPTMGLAPKEKKDLKPKKIINNQINLKGRLGDLLLIDVPNIFCPPSMGIYVMDVNLTNKSKELLKSEDVTIALSRNGKPLEDQKVIFRQDGATTGNTLNSRLFFKSPQTSFTLSVKYKGKEWKQIVDGKYLK
jgi:hypothetical protein